VSRNVEELLEAEGRAWRPFEMLDRLSDVQLDTPVAAAHDWSGRDLIAHLVGWLGDAIEVARELELGERSEAMERSRREFAARGDEINAEIQAAWRGLPLAEVRRRLRETPRELRGYLQAVPESRWLKPTENLRFFHIYTIEHYEDHVADLEAILGGAA
jgi:hypothetical protein